MLRALFGVPMDVPGPDSLLSSADLGRLLGSMTAVLVC